MHERRLAERGLDEIKNLGPALSDASKPENVERDRSSLSWPDCGLFQNAALYQIAIPQRVKSS